MYAIIAIATTLSPSSLAKVRSTVAKYGSGVVTLDITMDEEMSLGYLVVEKKHSDAETDVRFYETLYRLNYFLKRRNCCPYTYALGDLSAPSPLMHFEILQNASLHYTLQYNRHESVRE